VSAPRTLEASPRVVFQEVEGEMVLLDLDAERYYTLDDVGTRFWQLLTEHGNLERVVAAMLAEFDVDEETLRSDLDALVGRLRAAGLVVAV
jgi:coenzyme PQQ synthesis protein D (PqqD)